MIIKDSKIVSEVLDGLAKNTQSQYKTTLKQFLKFANCREGLKKKISIDDLVTEAKSDVKKTQERFDLFYKWLQNKEVDGYALREKTMRESSAYQRTYSYLLGFFVNLDIAFERKWRKSIPKITRVSEAIKKDKIYTFYDVDEKTRTIRFNRERMQQFLANLKLRDVAITLTLLSSSQDSNDLFKLNVGDIREQEINRIFWEGNRTKSSALFRTFISKEATKFIRKYIQQERRDADDKEPLFITSGWKGEKRRMTATNLSSVFREAARKMGIKWENGEHNPLRPKRMRHLFRTACDTAGITELYTNAFMGHKNSQGQDYSELSKAVLELEYLRVEPFLTVYGEVEESLEIKEDVRKLEARIADLNRRIEQQNDVIGDLSRFMESKVESITRKLWEKWLREQEEADREAEKELKEWREEKIKQTSQKPKGETY